MVTPGKVPQGRYQALNLRHLGSIRISRIQVLQDTRNNAREPDRIDSLAEHKVREIDTQEHDAHVVRYWPGVFWCLHVGDGARKARAGNLFPRFSVDFFRAGEARDQGHSLRALAGALGVGKNTAARDLNEDDEEDLQVSHDGTPASPAVTAGLDGKPYPAHRRGPSRDPRRLTGPRGRVRSTTKWGRHSY